MPLLDATRNLINAQRIGVMRPGAVLLNFAREGVVDNAAVIEALDANKLHAYICDFPANALKGHAKVVALPHLGASTEEAEENCAVMVAEQLADYLENGNILNSVNFPNVSMARESGLPAGDRQRQRAQHGGTDFFRAGSGAVSTSTTWSTSPRATWRIRWWMWTAW